MRRRLKYELGLETKTIRCVLPHFRYRAEMGGVVEHELCPVHTAVVDRDPHPNPAEVDAYEWLGWEDFAVAIGSTPHRFSPWCVAQVDELRAAHFSPPSINP